MFTSKTPKSTEQSQASRLNTEDLENALDYVMALGKQRKGDEPLALLRYITTAKDAAMGYLNKNDDFRKLMESECGKSISGSVVRALDADGDGNVTAKDFQALYDANLKKPLRDNRDTLDVILPYAGQCAVGLAIGFGVGRFARRVLRRKKLIVGVSLAMYSGLQYLAQLSLVNPKAAERLLKSQLSQVVGTDCDGKLSREKINRALENRFQFLSSKLGPNPILPGLAGYATLLLGLRRGLRRV
ncbi:hypothetical protein ERJ75_001181300 [Trypanosoma vivax]|nr:hypothetical protein TRVL_05338 [Trypanosoma vivax]KAH8609645.1 hypothetical protein ERJ75_001181300 [Trypanosoma vivax]